MPLNKRKQPLCFIFCYRDVAILFWDTFYLALTFDKEVEAITYDIFCFVIYLNWAAAK